MLTITFALVAVIALGLLVLVRAVKAAPVGFEDAEGFHAVRERGKVSSVEVARGDEGAALVPGVFAAS